VVFGSRSLAGHLLRGALGITALWVSIATMERSAWPSLVLMPLALWMFKGCPVCWTVGLFETAAQAALRRTER
jgi:hypothetical protein